MLKVQTIFLFVFITINAFSQRNFTPTTITYKSGEVKEGYATNFSNGHKYIVVKDKLKSKKRKVDNKNIKSILVKAKQDTFLLLQKPVFFSNDDVWMTLLKECSDFNLMGYLGFYEVNKKGKLKMYFKSAYYVIQNNEEEATYRLGDMFEEITDTHKRWDAVRLKDMQTFFKNDPDLRKFIKGKKRVSQMELLEFIDIKCQK